MKFPRSSGVLLHITSLPGGHGVGDLGASAYEFVDFLSRAGQTVWQILPLSPPAAGNSPYSAYSAFACNPLMISLVGLVRDQLLDESDVEQTQRLVAVGGPDSSACCSSTQRLAAPPAGSQVDFPCVAHRKEAALSRAYERFQNTASHPLRGPFLAFSKKHSAWLEDFARFEALMQQFGESDWSNWPAELVARDPLAIAQCDERLAEAIHYAKFKQFLFDRQWQSLKRYANHAGVQICGDMPIFVAHQSADVWANQSLFAVDEHGKPTKIAGVPPDYFSKTGQLWGNPQYDWDALEKTHYHWWTQRFGAAMRQFDLLRVDHFRGFEAYWEVPASARTAVGGSWKLGPGSKPFDAAREALGELPFIAEDLGLITEEVHQLRAQLGFPGMRVLQFGFDNPDDDFHRPDTYPVDSVGYTGTHDNDTLVGWLKNRKSSKAAPPSGGADTLAPDSLAPDPLAHWVATHEHAENEPLHWQLIDAVWQSQSSIAIVPMQDLLGLDNTARMNIPGQATGNWAWRMSSGAITAAMTDKLKELTVGAQRIPLAENSVVAPRPEAVAANR